MIRKRVFFALAAGLIAGNIPTIFSCNNVIKAENIVSDEAAPQNLLTMNQENQHRQKMLYNFNPSLRKIISMYSRVLSMNWIQ